MTLDTARAHARGALSFSPIAPTGPYPAQVGQTDLCRSVALESRTEEVPASGKSAIFAIRTGVIGAAIK
jgi:hypothetical protein